MTNWRNAKAIIKLREQINAAYPDRPTHTDGTIGDPQHASTKSDHNPNSQGVVTAWDITTAKFTDTFAEQLRAMGKRGDLRIKYVIYKGRIASRTDAWAWREYTGRSRHFDHIHLSVSPDPAQYDRTDPWNYNPAAPKPAQPYHYRRNLAYKSPMLTGADVKHMQQRLIHAGYAKLGSDDGVFGPGTKASLTAFQRAHKLPGTGVLDHDTAAVLG